MHRDQDFFGPVAPRLPHAVFALVACVLAACGGGGAGGHQGADASPSIVSFDAGAAEDAETRDLAAPESALPDADLRGPKLNSLIPNRGPLEGGTAVRIVGTSLLEGTVVKIGDRDCLGLTYVSDTAIECTTPTGFAPGPVSVTLRWSSGGIPSHVEDAFTYFVPVTVTAITPDRGPARGGTDLVIDGDGFVEPTELRIGGTLTPATLVDEHRLTAVTPPGAPGKAEVIVRNVNGEVHLDEGYTFFEPLLVQGITPQWGYTAGGTDVDLQGTGLVADSSVHFGPDAATVVSSELGRTHLHIQTPVGAPGLRPVIVENVNGTWRREDAFLYVDQAAAGFGAVGIAPSRVAVAGGDDIDVGGSGFDETTTVEADGVALDCTLTNTNIMHCTTPAHAAGPVDVVVARGNEHAALPGGLTYFARVDIYALRPARGAVAGGTYVEVTGEGFTEDMTLTLDNSPFQVVEFVDAGHVWAVTPPARPGLVTAGAATIDDAILLPEAFEYFDPVSRFGGVFGEPIDGAVNVTVFDAYSGEPIIGATAMAVPEGPDPSPPDVAEVLVGTTDINGEVVLSGKYVAAPQKVTAAAPDYEVATIDEVTVENLTVYLVPHNPPAGQGGGGGDPIANCSLTGTITGLDAMEKPLDGVLLAFVDTTHSSPYNRVMNLVPAPIGVLTTDGPFHVIVHPGEFAVIVTAGIVTQHDYDAYIGGRMDYWALHDTVYPVAMGFQRFISLSPGEDMDGLEIAIDKPMDLTIPATQANPPVGLPEKPYNYEAWPYLDFGAEGYWQLDTAAFGDTPALSVAHLPDIRGWDPDIQYLWMFWGHAGERLNILPPYTITTLEVRDITAGVDANPVSSLAILDTPTDGGPLGPERTTRWHWADGTTGEPTTPPDATVITIDSGSGLALWTYVVPGNVQEAELPVLPEDVTPGGLVQEDMRLYIIPFIAENGLNYGDFTYDDLSYYARRSYSISTTTFTP